MTSRLGTGKPLTFFSSVGSSCQYIRDFCVALAALVGPVQNIFFLTVHNFNSFVPMCPASWEGSRAGSPVSYPMCVSGPPLPPISPHHQKFIIKAPLLHPIGSYTIKIFIPSPLRSARLSRQLEKQFLCFTERRKTAVRER